MAQNYVYPASSQVTVSGIGTPNNAPIPSSSVLIAGESPTGNQAVVQTDSAGNLIVSPLTTTSTVTVVQPTGTNLHAVIDSQALPTGASTSALQTSGNTQLVTIASNQTNGTQVTAINNFPATQPVSGTVAVSAIAGALPAGANAIGSVSVSNFPATQPISGTVTANAGTGTFAISAAALPLPTGAATSANQATEISSLSTIATNTTGASTSALQTTGNTSLATIATNTTSVSTAANQTTANTSLATIVTNTTRQGTITDASGTTNATPNTNTQIFAANATRKYLFIGNPIFNTNNIYINFTTSFSSVAPNNISIVPGGSFVMESGFVSTEAIRIVSDGASVAYTAKQA